MILRLNSNTGIDNLRKYPSEVVDKLRALLTAGAQAYPDPRRRDFYDVENGLRMFYIHLSPSGRIWLLASWLKQAQESPKGQAPSLPRAANAAIR